MLHFGIYGCSVHASAWPVAVFTLAGLGLIAAPVRAISMRHDLPQSAYIDLGAQFPAVGRVDYGSVAGHCSGTLVAPELVLTAAHLWNAHKFSSSVPSASPPAGPLGASLEDAAFGFRPGRPQIVPEPSPMAFVVLALILSRLRPRHAKLHEFAPAR